MRLFVIASLLVFLTSFQQQTNPTQATQTGLQQHSAQREEGKGENDKPDSPPIPIIRSLDVKKPAAQPKDYDSYDPYKDTLYRWYLRGTLIGVAGGLLGIVLLLRSVKAAHKADDTLMDSEGALLWVNVKDTIVTSDVKKNEVGYRIYNIGRTRRSPSRRKLSCKWETI
jgi:hypothetical protein